MSYMHSKSINQLHLHKNTQPTTSKMRSTFGGEPHQAHASIMPAPPVSARGCWYTVVANRKEGNAPRAGPQKTKREMTPEIAVEMYHNIYR